MSALFDDFVSGYDQWYETALGRFVDTVETSAAFALLNPEAGDEILDVGCGTGNFTLKLAAKDCRVLGLDISTSMLALAQAKAEAAGLTARWLNRDVTELPNLTARFDKIISMAAFEFMPDQLKAINDMLALLKPGGLLVVGTIQKGSPWHTLYDSPAFEESVYRFARFKNKDELAAMAPAAFREAKECLFVPPGLAEAEYNLQAEAAWRGRNMGGFVCVSFQRKA